MGVLQGILILVGVLAGLFGLASLTQATIGVGVIAFGCLLAILARIAQAAAHAAQSRHAQEPRERTMAAATPETV